MEIINGLDKDLGICVNYIKTHNHARNIVRIDDNKYNIHGIFEMDNTWDSNIGEYSKNILNYDFYGFYLIPLTEHKRVFPTEELPSICTCTYDKENKEIYELLMYKKDINTLFGFDATEEKIKEYLKSTRPTLEYFKNIIYNVRIKEGYSPEEANKELEKIIEVNSQTYKTNSSYTESFKKR